MDFSHRIYSRRSCWNHALVRSTVQRRRCRLKRRPPCVGTRRSAFATRTKSGSEERGNALRIAVKMTTGACVTNVTGVSNSVFLLLMANEKPRPGPGSVLKSNVWFGVRRLFVCLLACVRACLCVCDEQLINRPSHRRGSWPGGAGARGAAICGWLWIRPVGHVRG